MVPETERLLRFEASCAFAIFRKVPFIYYVSTFLGLLDPLTVRWNEIKVAVLCARQYMPWNLLLIKVLNNFWYFKHQTSTMIWSEAYMKHNWRFVFEKRKKKLTKTISSIMFQMFLSLVKVWNIKNYLKLWLEVVDIRACTGVSTKLPP